MDKPDLIISSSPHIKSSFGLRAVMWNVVIALMPAVFTAVYYFRFNAVRIILVSLISCAAAEYVFLKLRRKTPDFSDGSCVVTAILFALILPPALPGWMVAAGAVFAVVFGKQVFGGLGYNIFNPALIGRAFLMASYPTYMTTWTYPFGYQGSVDAVTVATPLGLAKFSHIISPLKDLFWGNAAGSLGETCAFALILGGVYLLLMKVIDYRIPFSILFTITGLSLIFWFINPDKFFNPLFHLFAGGLLIGTFFMAADPVTSPITKRGRIVFGAGIGALVFIIRNWAGLPEGVMYSILVMNGLAPLINRVTLPKRFGV